MSGPGVLGPDGAAVAICTLADEQLRARLLAHPMAERVLIGPLTNQVHGVELLAEGLLARPAVRLLAVVGESAALRRLFLGEADWPNLSADHVAQLRCRVRFLECTEEELWESVRPYLQQVPLSGSPVQAAPMHTLVPAAERCFDEPDPAGYVIVGIAGGLLTATHYTVEGRRTQTLAGTDSESVAQALARAGLIGRTDHALYIGRELMKAEVAQRLGLRYVQDEPLQLT